jgi:hypothetical protein
MPILDLESLYSVVDMRRTELGLRWDDLAAELEVPVDDLRGLRSGADPHITTVFSAISWAKCDVSDFLTEDEAGHDRPSDATEKAERVAAFLRADRDLKPESAEAIEAVLQAAYDEFATSA